MVEKFNKKPLLSELSLRERIGQTICPIMRKILAADDIGEYIRNNPFGSFWISGNAKLDFVNVAYEVDPTTVDKEFSNAFRKLIGMKSQIFEI